MQSSGGLTIVTDTAGLLQLGAMVNAKSFNTSRYGVLIYIFYKFRYTTIVNLNDLELQLKIEVWA